MQRKREGNMLFEALTVGYLNQCAKKKRSLEILL